MPSFEKITLTNYDKQKGLDIQVRTPEDQLIMINVYVDIIENCVLKVELEDETDQEILLHTSIDKASFVPALHSFSDDKSYCYVKFDRHELHIKLESEGIVFDVWEMDDQDGECIDTSNLMYAELESDELEDA